MKIIAKKIGKFLFFSLIITAAISLIFFNNTGNLNFAKNIFLKLTDFIHKPFYYFGNQLKFLKTLAFEVKNLNEENSNLKNENVKLQSDLLEFSEIKKENELLKSALKIESEKKINLIFADVILKASAALENYFIINKGEDDGVKTGQGVLVHRIIVGKVADVYKDYSKVLMLSSPMLKLSAVTEQESVRGLVSGIGNQTAKMEFIEKSSKIMLKEMVITSGMDEKIPAGFLIGKIEKIESAESAVFQEVIIKLPIFLEQINQVFVIIK